MSKFIPQPEIVPLVLVKNDEYWLPYVLEASRGFFDRYVIYDVGSDDRTRDVINWFVDSEKHRCDFFVRYLPHCPPVVQGTFRNSMIAEARSEWYFILDGDEIYNSQGYKGILGSEFERMKIAYKEHGAIYGIVPRIEVLESLEWAQGADLTVSHHRVYHREAIFNGTHPGEFPIYTQKGERELWYNTGCVCYHFHNTARSSYDEYVPKRIERRGRKTYRPGDDFKIDIFERIPILRKPIEDFPRNPELKRLHG